MTAPDNIEHIYMPLLWEVGDGTIPVDAPAEDDDLHYALVDPAVLAALPEVQALIRAAELRGSKAMSESDFDCLILDAIAEAIKAMRKFPQPNYVISKFAEEAGEVVKAAIHCAENRETAENLRGEMKQAIAMLYRLWIEGDQVHGLPPIRTALQETQP